MSDYITFDLQVKILQRLPAKSLIRFRSVSKAWKSLIDSSEFIADHSHSVQNTEPQHLLVRYRDPVTTEENYVSFVDDDTYQSFAPTIPLPVELLVKPTMISSSHGLFCVHGYYQGSGRSPGYNFRREMVVLWNPSIRKSIAIDLIHTSSSPVPYISFGVCPIACNPKIIKMTRFDSWKVVVYTLSSGRWRSVSGNQLTKSIVLSKNQVVVGGFIYWSAYDADMTTVDGEYTELWGFYNLILSFDVANEKFRVIDLPDSFVDVPPDCLSCSSLRESLTVLEHSENSEYVVWMMENSVQKSFTKLFTIKAPRESIRRNFGFWKSGKFIMETKDDNGDPFGPAALVVYEQNSRHFTDLGIYGAAINQHLSSFFVDSYSETLLLLDR